MLNFNASGLLVPNNNIVTSIDYLERHFVHEIPSETRCEIFKKYLTYSNELKKVLNLDTLKQWVNGSFVTKIRNPKDIDLVTFVDFELRRMFETELKQFEAKSANEHFEVDAYLVTVFPQGHQKNFLFESDRVYWMDKFSRTRRDRTGKKNHKGFLEILY